MSSSNTENGRKRKTNSAFNRQNCASNIVTGTIFSNIVSESIDIVDKHQKRSLNQNEDSVTSRLLAVCKNAHRNCTKLLLKSNKALSVSDTNRVAQKQKNLLSDAVRFDEDAGSIPGVLNYHNREMLDMIQVIEDQKSTMS